MHTVITAADSTTVSGVFFEDLSVGQTMESCYSTITQEDIYAFAQLSQDHNPIHLSPQRAKKAGLPTPIAHGALVFARATGLAWQIGLFRKANTIFREAHLKFESFVFAGDSIALRMKVAELKPLPRIKQGKVVLEVTICNQHGTSVAEYEWEALVSMQSQTQEAGKT